MKLLSFLSCTLAVLLSGCSLLVTKQPVEKHKKNTSQLIVQENTRPFTKEALSELLTAEFAEHRGQFEKALAIYVVQAQKTKDPKVTKRAYQIAVYLENQAEQLNMAVLWATINPTDADANRAAFTELSRNGMESDTTPYLNEIFRQTKALDFLQLEEHPLPVQSYVQIMPHIDQLLNKDPSNNQLLYTKAILLSKSKEFTQALSLLDQLSKEAQQQTNVTLLKAYLLQSTGKTEEAFALLNKNIQSMPDNKQLRLDLGHRLINEGNLAGAKQQFSVLNKQYSDDEDIRFALALICLELGDTDEAIDYLNILLKNGVDTNVVYFYLATAYNKKGDQTKALSYYQQIASGQDLLNAKANVAKIFFEQNKIKEAQQFLRKSRQDQPSLAIPLYLFEVEQLQNSNKLSNAWQVINQAIKDNPDNTSLYYSRALLAEKSNKLSQAEQDLRFIIKREPENDTAINALGYILTNNTTRYEEALQLIKKALLLNPDNPATLDSLGWIYYKRGEFLEAKKHLQQAYDNSPDPEVAAHLGEVLWQQNKKPQARTVWSKALKENPQNTFLLETIKRLTGSKEP